MMLLIVSYMDALCANLAEDLSERHFVLSVHPNPWMMEGSFQHRQGNPSSLTKEELCQADLIICVVSKHLGAMMVSELLERVKDFPQSPFFCVKPRPVQGHVVCPKSPEECVCRVYREDEKLTTCVMDVPAIYGDDFLPDDLSVPFTTHTRSNRFVLAGDDDSICELMVSVKRFF